MQFQSFNIMVLSLIEAALKASNFSTVKLTVSVIVTDVCASSVCSGPAYAGRVCRNSSASAAGVNTFREAIVLWRALRVVVAGARLPRRPGVHGRSVRPPDGIHLPSQNRTGK